ncbi:MAG: type II secretion system protein GspI [Alphaproteobacteria bacterium PA4]|nr:MAG: type II secretion system protein GspI [Alphaproteobacteria bacterium PA4]
MVPRQSGFTLVEVLVALAIFSLAALAMLRLQGAGLGTAARLDEKAMAVIVARNQAVLLLVQPQPPAFGATAGEVVNGGRRWRWVQAVERSPDPRLQKIEIRVAGADGGTAATLTLVRRAT